MRFVPIIFAALGTGLAVGIGGWPGRATSIVCAAVLGWCLRALLHPTAPRRT